MFDFCLGDCNEPVSALEMLTDYGVPEDIIDGVLCVHARELAEKIRADADEWDGWPEKQAFMRYAADLIDPEVS
ncbi:hypothetical protein [Streptomyces sp. NPDC058542]|uniref:hypothetical protein n=1 Tax=Streptomyces sp. NPDC058542 TaxID=3346543 RepID=UPI003665715A